MFARKSGEEQQEYLKVRFTDVVISSYQQGGSSGSGDVPVEQVSCSFARIDLEYRGINSDGSLGDPVTEMFDLKKNRPSRKVGH